MPAKKDSKTRRPATRRLKKSPKKKTPEKNLRDKINVHALIEALEQHVLGKKEMTSTQVSAALALLKKTLPDISEAARRTAPETDGAPHEEALGLLE